MSKINIKEITSKLKEGKNSTFKTDDFLAKNTYSDEHFGIDIRIIVNDISFRRFDKNEKPQQTDFIKSPKEARKIAKAFDLLYELIDFDSSNSKDEIIINGEKYRKVK